MKVNDMKRKNEVLIDIDIGKIRDYYFNIFNKPLNVDPCFIAHINEQILDIKHENYTVNELKLALTETSNVVGNDGVSANMILNCDENIIKSKLFYIRRIKRIITKIGTSFFVNILWSGG